MITPEERGDLYNKLFDLLHDKSGDYQMDRFDLSKLTEKYGRDEVFWMLQVLREDLQR